MTAYLPRIRKSLVAAVGAGITAVVAAWPDGITADEWGKVAAAAVATALAVWATPNKPKEG